MEQQRRAGRDAHIADRQEHRAGRLTVTVDAKAFARRVVLVDHRQELIEDRHGGRAVTHA